MKGSPHLRTIALAAAAAALALPAFSAGKPSSNRAAAQSKAAPPAAPAGPRKSDRDGDDVFDDLEARLSGAPADRRVQVMVRLRSDATARRVRDIARAVGEVSVKDRFEVVDGFAATIDAGRVRALARRSDVVAVEEDAVVRAVNDSAQPSFGVTEARLDAPSLDGDAAGGRAVYSKDDLVAAVIDSGIHGAHRDLDEGKVLAFKDFVNGRTDPYDDNGHGTHVAGTIAGDGDGRADGRYRGVAPDAALVGVKVLGASGSGRTSDVTAGIDWVVQNRALYGIEAINLSLGVKGCADGTDLTSLAVNNAHAAGLVVAVAAGNEGPGTCTVGSPGAARDAVTVGAMADTGPLGFHQASFSSRGKTADGRIKPDVSAPGVGVTSAATGTIDGYSTKSGTSMATPFVAGVALLMRDASPGLGSQQVKEKLTQTAVDWGRGGDNRTAGSRGDDIDYGAGRLDAYAALRSAGAPIDSPPAVPDHALHEGTLAGTGATLEYPIEVTSTAFPVAATLIIPAVTGATSRTTDFDLYLIDPSGAVVDRSELITRQEEVQFAPTVPGTYRVRVRSYSGSGGFFVDVSAGTADRTPPDTSIDSGPSGTAETSSAEFAFSSSEAGSTFECRLDSGSWSACDSPARYSGLPDGEHTFLVRAIDAAGNTDASPAERVWTVDGSPYRDAVLATPGLLSYWRLGEGSGTTAADSKGSRHGSYANGVGLGAAGALAGDPDRAASFDGVDDRVTLPAVGTSVDFTIEGWQRLASGAGYNNTLYGRSNKVRVISRATSYHASVWLGGVNYALDKPSPGNVGTWVHWALVRSGATLRLYRDGVEVDSRSDLPAATPAELVGTIGSQDAVYPTKGEVDEVAVYGVALSGAAVAQHYTAGTAP